MITREKEPLNLEMAFGQLNGLITPTEQFYVRCHFPIPQADASGWTLKIEGVVERPTQFSLDELRQLSVENPIVTMECAGNGRLFLVPKVKGVQWELGAVGTAEWTGVRLADVLQRAGVKHAAREILLEGADNGTIGELPRPAGKIHYARSVPIEKAVDDVLLAFDMNGAPLTPSHGFPLRAIVPGWYGMASVKWLQRIVVVDQPFQGYYQTVDYAFWRPTAAGPVLVPLTEMPVKAQISKPESGELICADATYVIKGAAWTSGAEIEKVEVSCDGGVSWQPAALQGEPVKNAWRLWQFEWMKPRQGTQTIMARATDSRGRVQPMDRDGNSGTYMIHHCLPVEVHVR